MSSNENSEDGRFENAGFKNSRFVRLDMGQVRSRALNVGTVIHHDVIQPRREPPFEALFLAHYRALRELARLDVPGAAVVAVHVPSGRLAGRLWLARHDVSRPGPSAAIIGRHSQCDLVLDDEDVSLRHLALVLPPIGAAPLRFSLHDLRTVSGLRGVLGRPMGGAHVVGAGFFEVGAYALFCVATGVPERWPELASEAWRYATGSTTALRIVRAEERVSDRPEWCMTPSSVSAIRGPLHTNARLVEHAEERVCTLVVTAGARRERLALGSSALQRGILLGRYSRCDSGGIWEDDQVSRVHLLVLRIDGEVYAFDTASMNGVYLDAAGVQGTAPEEVRVVDLSGGDRAVLGEGIGRVSLAP